MKILFAVSELTPLVKVGGLADVSGALPKELSGLGIELSIIMPRFEAIAEKYLKAEVELLRLPVRLGNRRQLVIVSRVFLPETKIPVFLLSGGQLLSFEGPYSKGPGSANFGLFRYALLSKVAIELIDQKIIEADIIHVHDWMTGLIPIYLKADNRRSPKTLLTIHNLSSQISIEKTWLKLIDLRPEDLAYRKNRRTKSVNLFAEAIVRADFLNTVSERYGQEIKTKTFGQGLDHLLLAREKELTGILNGIDTRLFNPMTDQNIAFRYGLKSLDQKKKNRLSLEEEFSLKIDEKRPLFGGVTRLAEQKGIDLILRVIPKIVKARAGLVLLGTGEKEIESALLEEAKKYPRQVKAIIGFDAPLAQRIYAGSDAFLVPSRFEPSGLTQMIAMRYGALPIVRKTGGLADTVREGRTGFLFKRFEAGALYAAIKRALAVYENRPSQWRKMQAEGMGTDFSWRKSAKKYLSLYQRMLDRKDD